MHARPSNVNTSKQPIILVGCPPVMSKATPAADEVSRVLHSGTPTSTLLRPQQPSKTPESAAFVSQQFFNIYQSSSLFLHVLFFRSLLERISLVFVAVSTFETGNVTPSKLKKIRLTLKSKGVLEQMVSTELNGNQHEGAHVKSSFFELDKQ